MSGKHTDSCAIRVIEYQANYKTIAEYQGGYEYQPLSGGAGNGFHSFCG